MASIEGYDHQPGRHCGAAAIRNVTRHYGWRYSEASSIVGSIADREETIFEDLAAELGRVEDYER